MRNLDFQEEKVGRGATEYLYKRGNAAMGGGKGGGGTVQFACLDPEEMNPENEEIPANEVNLAIGFINLANITGSGNWERKNWAEERSSITDTGFNGWGFRSYEWLCRYAEYLRVFTLRKNWRGPKKRVGICVCESARAGVGIKHHPAYLCK